MNLRNEKIHLCDWRYVRRQRIQLSIANANITYILNMYCEKKRKKEKKKNKKYIKKKVFEQLSFEMFIV